MDFNVALPENQRTEIAAAAADRDLGPFVAVAHAPSGTGGPQAPSSHGGSAFGGFACIVIGVAFVVLGIAGNAPIGDHVIIVCGGALLALAGRWLVRDHRRERASDTYHFANGLVQWNTQTLSATAYRWSDFTDVTDRFHVARAYGVTQSVDYRAVLSRPGAEPITLSATAPSKKRLLRDTAALRAMVGAAMRGSGMPTL
jgi:hypothetical protein